LNLGQQKQARELLAVQGCAFRKQEGRNVRLVGVCRLVERRPAAIVRVIDVGIGGEQHLDRRHTGLPVRLFAEARGETQKRVAIGPALTGLAGIRE
jgi:hypothetical protein